MACFPTTPEASGLPDTITSIILYCVLATWYADWVKQIEVVAAVIIREGRVFAAQRNGKGEVGFKWEFPGGKLEPGETRQAALTRELEEELEVAARVGNFMMTVTHGYKTFHLTMHCYLVEIPSSVIVLKEHLDSRWLSASELDTVDWAEADRPVVRRVKELLTQ